MSLTIKKVPTVLSIHQMDEEEDPKFAGAVRRCCRAGKKLPTLTFAPSRPPTRAHEEGSVLRVVRRPQSPRHRRVLQRGDRVVQLR